MGTPCEIYRSAPTRLPSWVRVLLALVGLALLGLGAWVLGLPLGGDGGWWTAAGGAAAIVLGLCVLVATARGRIWRWMWFVGSW